MRRYCTSIYFLRIIIMVSPKAMRMTLGQSAYNCIEVSVDLFKVLSAFLVSNQDAT